MPKKEGQGGWIEGRKKTERRKRTNSRGLSREEAMSLYTEKAVAETNPAVGLVIQPPAAQRYLSVV